MKPTRSSRGFSFPRFLGALLIAAFSLELCPAPAVALRQEPPAEGSPATLAGMEERLRSTPSSSSTSGLEEGIGKLEQVRASLSDLPTYAVPTAWLWGALDFLLHSEFQGEGLMGQASAEYAETRNWLREEHPDLEDPLSVDPLPPTAPTSVMAFRITTRTGLYVLAVQTQDLHAGGSAWTHVRLEQVEADLRYRLDEIVTGEAFPWDPPYHYVGSYLRGESDRFGDPNGQERWGIKPGDRRGDFQFFRVVPAEGPISQLRWEDLLAPAVPSRGRPLQFSRPADGQQHLLIKDSHLGVAADVITGRPFTGEGTLLMVTFPNGNSGVALRDSATSQPYQVKDLRPVSRLQRKQRGVEFKVLCTGPAASFEGIVLDTVRHIREWNSWDGGRTRAAKLDEFVDSVRRLPRGVLVDLRREGVPLAELSRRISPRIFHRRTKRDQRLYIFRLTLGGHLYLVEMVFPPSYEVHWTPQGKIDIRSKGNRPLRWRMVVTTDFPALTPIPREALLGEETLAYGERSEVLRRELEDLEFLAFDEFFAAGSHRFLQFFGRDTLIWLRMFSPLLTPEAHQTALQGVLDRVSPEGRLPSVEELDDQVAYERMEGFCWACQHMNEPEGMDRLYQSARALGDFARGQAPARDLKYGVPDVDVMLLPALADYIRRSDVPLARKVEFFRRQAPSGASNLTAVVRNADGVLRTALAYVEKRRAREPWPAGLVGTQREGDFANWRDVQYGLGYGLYPADVNAEWIPSAVKACREVLRFIQETPLGEGGQLEQMAQSGNFPALGTVLEGEYGSLFEEFGGAWEDVRDRFSWPLTPEEIRARLGRYLQQVHPRERDWLLSQPLGSQIQLGHFLQADGPVPAILQPEVRYFPVALNREGQPVPVPASDAIVALMDPALPAWRLAEILTPLLLPFPAGLWTPAGFVVASSALSDDDRLWREISRTAYGGSVVYGWQMEFFKQGLFRQLTRPDLAGDPQLRAVLYSAFEACCDATPVEMTGQELWTWDVDERGFRVTAFGNLPGHNDESNPIQLWSTSSVEILRPQAREAAQRQGLPLLRGGELLDSLAQLRQRYPRPEPAAGEGAGLEEKPRVAMLSMSLPPGGGGVNIVIANQVALLKAGGYPLTMLGGQVIAWTPEMKANPPEDNVYTRAGIPLHIIGPLDLQGDVEGDARSGTLDLEEFNRQVEALQQRIEAAIADADVILIHQYMTMPSNLLAVEAMGRLARKHQGRKRFIAWVHNVLPGKVAGWPLSQITEMNPRMEYVAVSPQLRDQTLGLFGVRSWPWMISVIKNSISVTNFFDVHPKVLKTYFDNRLYDAEYLLFYPARLVETKEVAGAVAAVKRARDRGHDARLVIATTAYEGQIPGEQQDYYRRLLELRRRLGLTDKEVMIYLHDPAPDDLKSQKEIRDWLFLSDGLLFTSQQETGGIPVKEAKMARRIVFHADYDVLNAETDGHPHVPRFPLKQHWESEEGYGGMVGDHIVGYLESAEGRTDISLGRAQKHELKQSFEGLLNLLSAWFNLPPTGKRAIRAGTRNFLSTGQLVEEAITAAKDAGYRAFEVNFEDFKPSDVNSSSRVAIREAASGLRLTCRLADFPAHPLDGAEQLLQDAAIFAMESGAQGISLPARGLDPARAELIVRAAEWAKAEAARRGVPLPDVLFSVENAWREDWSEWSIIAPEILRSYFAGKPVGLSLWMDSFQAWDSDGPLYYVDTARLKLSTVYLGEDFFRFPHAIEKARPLLVEMRRRHWDGDVIGQSIVRIQDGRYDREWEEFKVAFLDRVIAEAYLPDDTSASLRNGGELVGSPSMEARPPETGAGLEELVPGVRAAAESRRPVAVLFDPMLVPGASDEERQVNLIGLAGNLRAAFDWPEDLPLQLGLLSEKTIFQAEGYRVVEVVPHPESLQQVLPESALPLVVAEALGAFGGRLLINVGSYDDLQDVTLPEILSTLSQVFA